MATAREHMQKEIHLANANHADKVAAHHDGKEKTHLQHAAVHKKIHKNGGMSDDQEGPHLSFALLHEQDAALHKAHSADWREYAGSQRAAAEKCEKGADATDLNKLLPTQVSVIAPDRSNIRTVLRPGQREIQANVTPELEKIIGINEESMHAEQELSLRK
jgi:hypothetical protein